MRKTKPRPTPEIYWLDETDYNKAVFKLTGAILTALDSMYNMYGYKELNTEMANQLVKLAEDFSLRCRGLDKPIQFKGG
jgi:hypothetical protein